MKKQSSQPSKKTFYAAVAGTILVALCCFTPILVITLAAVGMSAFTPYLDYVLLPALVLMIALAFVSYIRWKKSFNPYKGVEIMEVSELNNLVILDRYLEPLKGRFNVCNDKMRFLALLSPTCPL